MGVRKEWLATKEAGWLGIRSFKWGRNSWHRHTRVNFSRMRKTGRLPNPDRYVSA